MLSAALNFFNKLTGNQVSVKYLANKYKLRNIHKANAESGRRDQVLEKITHFDKWKLTQFWEMSFFFELVFTQVNVIHCASYVIQVIQDLQVCSSMYFKNFRKGSFHRFFKGHFTTSN